MAVAIGQGFLEVNAKQLGTFATKFTPNVGSESLDQTTFGQTTRIKAGGLLIHTLDVEFLYANSTSAPEPILFPLRGTTSCVEWRSFNVCTTVINPSYSGIMTLTELGLPVSVGELFSMSAKFEASSALSRASSS